VRMLDHECNELLCCEVAPVFTAFPVVVEVAVLAKKSIRRRRAASAPARRPSAFMDQLSAGRKQSPNQPGDLLVLPPSSRSLLDKLTSKGFQQLQQRMARVCAAPSSRADCEASTSEFALTSWANETSDAETDSTCAASDDLQKSSDRRQRGKKPSLARRRRCGSPRAKLGNFAGSEAWGVHRPFQWW